MKRDVYLIVLDECASREVPGDHFAFDNGPFEDGLRRRGFPDGASPAVAWLPQNSRSIRVVDPDAQQPLRGRGVSSLDGAQLEARVGAHRVPPGAARDVALRADGAAIGIIRPDRGGVAFRERLTVVERMSGVLRHDFRATIPPEPTDVYFSPEERPLALELVPPSMLRPSATSEASAADGVTLARDSEDGSPTILDRH